MPVLLFCLQQSSLGIIVASSFFDSVLSGISQRPTAAVSFRPVSTRKSRAKRLSLLLRSLAASSSSLPVLGPDRVRLTRKDLLPMLSWGEPVSLLDLVSKPRST